MRSKYFHPESLKKMFEQANLNKQQYLTAVCRSALRQKTAKIFRDVKRTIPHQCNIKQKSIKVILVRIILIGLF
jgi:hypothetical protein